MNLPRYRISSVLLVFTVAAVLLSYTQVRRRDLARSFASLEAKGCNAGFEDHWLWPMVPAIADVMFRELPSGEYALEYAQPSGTERFGAMDSAVERFKALRSETLALGVKQVQFHKVLTDPTSNREALCTYDLEALEIECARIPLPSPNNY